MKQRNFLCQSQLHPADLPGRSLFKGLPLWLKLNPAVLVALDGHLSRYNPRNPTEPC